MNNNALIHYGIRGMKWGVRRYQNKDGSLTPAGRKRYDDSNDGTTKSSTSKSTSDSNKKSISEMTDEELNRAVRRLQLEKQYRDLSPKNISAGQKFVDTVMKQVITPAATEAGKKVLKDLIEKKAREVTGLPAGGNSGGNTNRDRDRD